MEKDGLGEFVHFGRGVWEEGRVNMWSTSASDHGGHRGGFVISHHMSAIRSESLSRGCRRLREEFEVRGFIAQKVLWNIAK